MSSAWLAEGSDTRVRYLDATILLVDLVAFSTLTERLARRGRVGAERVTAILEPLFARMLDAAYDDGASLLIWGGDAMLLAFDGADHPARAARGAMAMLDVVGRRGRVEGTRLSISAGLHTGRFAAALVGQPGGHLVLELAGDDVSRTVALQGAAGAGEVLVSREVADRLPAASVEAVGTQLRLVQAPPGPRSGVLPRGAHSSRDLERLVSPAIREHLRSDVRDAEHRRIAAAFVRVRGCDALLADAGSDALADALERTTQIVQSAAERHGVTLFDWMVMEDGGSFLLTAGAPRNDGHVDERILRMGRDVIDADPPLPVSVGAHRGPVFVSDFGPEYRRTYLVIGDAVNVAARLASRAEPRDFLATEELLDHAVSEFARSPVTPLAVKGRRAEVRACRVGGRAAHVAESGNDALVQRDGERGAADAAWQRARTGHGSYLELVGPAGIGKTAFLDEVARRGPAVLIRADPSLSSTPYAGAAAVLRYALGPDVTDAESLRDCVSAVAPEVLPWLPLVGKVLDIAVPSTLEVDSLDERFGRERLETSTITLLSALLVDPLIIGVDDVDDMDEASAHVIAAIGAVAGERPWLVVVTRRTPTDADGRSGAQVLPLRPLDEEGAVAVVRRALAGAPATRGDVAQIVERAAGNPLFLRVLADALAGGESSAGLPERVEDVVVRQVDRLGPSDRRLLRVASVLGETFDRGLLAEVAAGQGIEADDVAITALAGAITVDGGTCRFAHRLLRETAYEGMSHRTRRIVHAAAADAIERQAPDPDAVADVLSGHYLRAGHPDRAWHYAPIAAERAVAKYAFATAEALYARAVSAGTRMRTLTPQDRARVHWAAARAQRRTGRLEEALASFAKAWRGMAPDSDDAVMILIDRASLEQRMGRNSAAMRSVMRGLRILDGATGAAASRLRSELAMVGSGIRLSQGRYSDALDFARRAEHEGDAGGDAEARAHAASVVFSSLLMLGVPCAEEGRAALVANEEAGLLLGQAEVLNNLAVLSWMEGRGEESLAEFGQARERARAGGDELQAAFTQVNEGDILARLGRSAEAVEVIDDVLPSLLAQRAEAFEAAARRARAMALLDLDDPEAARAEIDAARANQERLGEWDEVAESDAVRARVLMRSGQVDAAVEQARSALDAVRASGAAHLLPLVLRTAADALVSAGCDDEARGLLKEALAACDAVAESERGHVLVAMAALAEGAERQGLLDAGAEALASLGYSA